MAAGVFCNTDILFQIFFELLRVRRSIVGFLVREDDKAWLAARRLFHIAALDAVDRNAAALACLAEIGGKLHSQRYILLTRLGQRGFEDNV